MDKNKALKLKKVIIPMLLVLIGLGFWWTWQTYFQKDSGLLEATGSIEATKVELSAKAAGVIKSLTLKGGDKVEKNQLVGELQRNDLVAQRERDALSIVKAENALSDLLSGAREQELREARANIKVILTAVQRTGDDLRRIEALVASGGASSVDLEKAKAAKDTADAQLEAVQARLSLLEKGSRPDVIQSARTEVERSKAVLKATEAALEDLKIISPLAGVALSRNYEPGEYVQPGASIATVADLNDLWVKVYVPTDDLPRIRLGQPVEITVSGSDQTFTGQVSEIASQGEFTPKTIQTKKERANVVFKVKISLSSTGGILKPGMPADVVFLEEADS